MKFLNHYMSDDMCRNVDATVRCLSKTNCRLKQFRLEPKWLARGGWRNTGAATRTPASPPFLDAVEKLVLLGAQLCKLVLLVLAAADCRQVCPKSSTLAPRLVGCGCRPIRWGPGFDLWSGHSEQLVHWCTQWEARGRRYRPGTRANFHQRGALAVRC